MKIYISSILILFLFSCTNKSGETSDVSIGDVEEVIVKNGLPGLLAQIEGDGCNEYLVVLGKTTHDMADLWNTKPENISITGFMKSSGLNEQITGYIRKNDVIEKTTIIPEMIISSFNMEAKCYFPDQERKIKRSTTLVFEESDKIMRIMIEEKF